MTNVRAMPLPTRYVEPAPRKRKRKAKQPPAKAQGNWPKPEPLRGAAHGTRDAALASAVFDWIEHATPGAAWHWTKPRRHVPAAVGWIAVAVAVIALLMIGGRPY